VTRRLSVALAVAAGIALPAAALAAPPAADPWGAVRPLLGEWVGEPSGRPGDPVSSTFAFELQLDGGVLVRRHRSVLPPSAGAGPGATHEDLLVAWPEGGGLRAAYWDNEGHVIHYRVTAEGGTVRFDSEPGPGPRFRLEYALRPDGGLAITFSAAPPGGELKTYLAGGAHRRAG
jgi:hypothetical protein